MIFKPLGGFGWKDERFDNFFGFFKRPGNWLTEAFGYVLIIPILAFIMFLLLKLTGFKIIFDLLFNYIELLLTIYPLCENGNKFCLSVDIIDIIFSLILYHCCILYEFINKILSVFFLFSFKVIMFLVSVYI